MNTRKRVLLLSLGALLSAAGFFYQRKGYFVYRNHLGQMMFAPALIATGFLLSLSAFLPSGERIYKRITTKRPKAVFNHVKRNKKSQSK